MTRTMLAIACALVASSAPHQPPRFRASAEAVTVDVLVIDGNRPLAGLAAGDFELRDSGVLQSVSAAAMADVPVSVMLALDVSNSVRGPTLTRLKAAVRAAIDPLGPGDRAALVTFNHAVALRTGWDAPPESFREVVESLEAGGFTSLNDGVFSAMQLRDPLVGRRSLLIVFTDGADSSSWLPARAVLEKGRRTDIVVYAVIEYSGIVPINYASGVQLWPRDLRSLYPAEFLRDLTNVTGGERFLSPRASNLQELFTRIVTDFRSRYVLTYTPQGVDTPGWHPIEVKLKGGRRGRITARRGYLR